MDTHLSVDGRVQQNRIAQTALKIVRGECSRHVTDMEGNGLLVVPIHRLVVFESVGLDDQRFL
jgi:hypothetical protein